MTIAGLAAAANLGKVLLIELTLVGVYKMLSNLIDTNQFDTIFIQL